MPETSPRPKMRPSLKLPYGDIEKIERVVWDEARGEGVEGRNAVRGVIFNRLMSDRFPDTVDEILTGDQFEGVGKYGSALFIPAPEEELAAQIDEFTDYVQLGEDASGGRTFFQNKAKTSKRGTDFSGPDPMTVGNHTFTRGYGNQEPVYDVNFSHDIEIVYPEYAQSGFADGGLATPPEEESFWDRWNPLTGSYRRETPASVKAADAALEYAPVTSTLYTANDIDEELDQEDPSYLSIAAMIGSELIGNAPLIGSAGKSLIRKGVKSADEVIPAINRQMDVSEYDTMWNTFEEISDPVEWQKSVKSYVKESRDVDPVVRTPELEDSARQLRDGLITREQHLENVQTYKPVNPWDQLPREPSNKSLVFSLKPNQRADGKFVLDDTVSAQYGVDKSGLSVGDRFNGRLDIPAYKDYDTWIVAGTSPAEKGTHYAKAVHYTGSDGKPVRFAASQKQGEKIGTGEADKTGYATVAGWVKDLDADAIRMKADTYLNDPEWTQVGFDPRRQGAFYVRNGDNIGAAVTEADEVIQIGPLVLARNAKIDSNYTGYALGGLAVARKGIMTPEGEDMANKKFQLDENKADLNNDGNLSSYEKQRAEAVQKADADEIEMYHGGMMGPVDPVSGNEIPIGSSAEEVRDDIEINISQGEYVLPADVVKWHGLKHILDMQEEAKMGLMAMDAMGLIKGSDEEAEEMVTECPLCQGAGCEECEGEEDMIETPEGEEVEVASVEVSEEEPEVNETEEYAESDYSKKTSMFGMVKKPKVTFIV